MKPRSDVSHRLEALEREIGERMCSCKSVRLIIEGRESQAVCPTHGTHRGPVVRLSAVDAQL